MNFQKLITGGRAAIEAAQAELKALTGRFPDAPGALTVYHGSPHVFDSFDFENNLRKGEGALAYGPGGYLTGNRELAEHYARTLAARLSQGTPPWWSDGPLGGGHMPMQQALREDTPAMLRWLQAKAFLGLKDKGYFDPGAGALMDSLYDKQPGDLARYYAPNHLNVDPTQQAIESTGLTPQRFLGRVTADRKDQILEAAQKLPSDMPSPLAMWTPAQGTVRPAPSGPVGRVFGNTIVGRNLLYRDLAKEGQLRSLAAAEAGAPGPKLKLNMSRDGYLDMGKLGDLASWDGNPVYHPGVPGEPRLRNLYEAQLNVNPNDMLLYDAPYAEQNENVKGALNNLAELSPRIKTMMKNPGMPLFPGGDWAGAVPQNLEGMKMMREAGIPATAYLRAGPRSGGLKDTFDPEDFNFVLHDPDRIGSLTRTPFAQGGSVTDVEPKPTDAQKEAGNYKKEHRHVLGMRVSIENKAGSTRSGTARDGTEWSQHMANDYGYFRGTTGRDKDHIDVFFGRGDPAAHPIHVIDQVDPGSGEFDEHKVVLGEPSPEHALEVYHANYEPGWRGADSVTAADVPTFKSWAFDGKRKMKPFSEERPGYAFGGLVKKIAQLAGKGEEAAVDLSKRKMITLPSTESPQSTSAGSAVDQALSAPLTRRSVLARTASTAARQYLPEAEAAPLMKGMSGYMGALQARLGAKSLNEVMRVLREGPYHPGEGADPAQLAGYQRHLESFNRAFLEPHQAALKDVGLPENAVDTRDLLELRNVARGHADSGTLPGHDPDEVMQLIEHMKTDPSAYADGGAVMGVYPSAGKRTHNDREGAKEVPAQLLRSAFTNTYGFPGTVEGWARAGLRKLGADVDPEPFLPDQEQLSGALSRLGYPTATSPAGEAGAAIGDWVPLTPNNILTRFAR